MGNVQYLSSKPGICKIISLLLGAVVVALACHSHFDSYTYHFVPRNRDWVPEREEFLIGTSIVAFIISAIYLIVHLGSEGIENSKGNKAMDCIFHVLAGAMLVGAGGFMVYSAEEIRKKVLCQGGGAFGGPYGGGLGGGIGGGFPPSYGQNIYNNHNIFGRSYDFNYNGYNYNYQFRNICQHYDEKLAAGILGMINGFLYGAIAIFVMAAPTP